MKIPVINYDALLRGDEKQFQSLKNAVQDIGFLMVENTPISADEIEKIIKIYRQFFHLPEEQKADFDMALTGSNRGWGRSKGEQVNPNANPDYKQVFDVGVELDDNHPMREITYYAPNLWPNENFQKNIIKYYENAFAISMNLLRFIAKAADMPEDYFDDKFSPPMALLRANFYPQRPHDATEKDFGIAPHTDYGCLTLLASDGVPGLEVEMPNGDWERVEPNAGQFVINFGEMLENWTNHKVKATLHRVIGSNLERISVPYFFNPAYSTNVAPFASGEILQAGDYLTKRYNETYLHKKTA